MIDFKEKNGRVRHYECTARACIELCFANIECLSKIALADSDQHIKELGGEQKLLDLMNGYFNLAEKLAAWDKTMTDIKYDSF